MTYTYVELQRDQSFLHSYVHAMVVIDNGRSFEFIHNFPPCGKVSIDSMLSEWIHSTSNHSANMLALFVRQWRNRRRWLVLKNRHFFDCFILPLTNLQYKGVASEQHSRDEWWIDRF
ncbi:hypothetical protein LZZ85_14310 [Terrimonas sp. NA20]|uniref:Uncharacterized protein n=1 Tax=Terrimonas ginsenosidimutans TaxID=2908004 RepID=A0ABS9KT14_9BACT|nr:hypothetical protein [Terrimonas ginsenosidimutans]MCG2615469.1 hypothetical protein [Terrimonas ginsenosidimutans]